jgi:hypothetical protein
MGTPVTASLTTPEIDHVVGAGVDGGLGDVGGPEEDPPHAVAYVLSTRARTRLDEDATAHLSRNRIGSAFRRRTAAGHVKGSAEIIPRL